MYTTAAGLTFDADGAALTYAIVFAAAGLNQAPGIMYMNFTAVHPNGTMDAELAIAIGKLGGAPAKQYVIGSTKKIATAAPPVPAAAAAAVPAPAAPSTTPLRQVASRSSYAAPRLPDLDGSGYPPYALIFQPGECTRNDGGQHPLPPQPGPPGPPPPPAPPAPPPGPHQCAIHIHHTEGCFNYSDWRPGTAGM